VHEALIPLLVGAAGAPPDQLLSRDRPLPNQSKTSVCGIGLNDRSNFRAGVEGRVPITNREVGFKALQSAPGPSLSNHSHHLFLKIYETCTAGSSYFGAVPLNCVEPLIVTTTITTTATQQPTQQATAAK